MAPKRVEKTTGELVKEIPKEDEIVEVQVPRLVPLSHGQADIVFNFRMGISTLGLSKPDEVFNFPVGQRAISACYTNAISTSAAASQHQSHSTTGSPTDWMRL